MASRPPPPCRFFQIGQCSQGIACKFAHVKGAPVVKSTTPCKFWFERGSCVHGDRCAFSHTKQAAASNDAVKAATPPVAVPKPVVPSHGPPSPQPPIPQAPPTEVLQAMDPAAQRQALGQCVYPRAVRCVGAGLAGKITGMLLEMHPAALLPLLGAPDAFASAVRRALEALPAQMIEGLGGGGSGDRAPLSNDPASDAALHSLEPTAAEAFASSQLTCGVCLEPVVSKRGRFGLLEGCDHSFCVECIRQWRATHAIRPDVARSCPECRAPSHFVVPSAVHFVGPRKAALTAAYLARLRKIDCRHFDRGRGTCPFGGSCFYSHRDDLGNEVKLEPRVALGRGGSTVLPAYQLSDYLFPDGRGSAVLSDTDALLATIPLDISQEEPMQQEPSS
jgi:E3 ubiquitin-protein ligase makorin